jgi:DNA-binding NtrC family response regulator
VRRIFVVDDEHCIAETLVVILRQTGYDASAFYNARSALERVELCCPELVISDVIMPGMSGLNMAILIQQRHPACKILLFSGNASTLNSLEMVGKQGHDFELLAKPINPTDMLAKVASTAHESERD